VDEWTVVSDTDGRLEASVRGDIDLANGRQLVAQLETLICGPGQRIEIDLSKVEFMDSSGLAALIEAQHLAVERGSQLILVATSPQVAGLLAITGCVNLFTVAPQVTPPSARATRIS